MRSYRWDKRREKKQKRKRFAGFTVFDGVLLFLIFCLGLFFFYAFLSISFGTSYCFEQIANYGATPITMPVFKAMFFASIILFVLWCAVLVFNMGGQPSWFRFAWDGFLGLCIMIMCGLYFHLSVWSKPNPPDGTLGIGEGVWTTENGTPEWRKLPPDQIPLEWTGGKIEYSPDYRRQECVWLEDNKIAVTLGSAITVNNFDAYVERRKTGILREGYYYKYRTAKLKLSEFIAAFLHPSSHMESAIATQFTRPLSPIERKRFIEKQTCINLAFDPSIPDTKPRLEIEEICDPLWSHEEPTDLLWD